jgi:hypothetical protein
LGSEVAVISVHMPHSPKPGGIHLMRDRDAVDGRVSCDRIFDGSAECSALVKKSAN